MTRTRKPSAAADRSWQQAQAPLTSYHLRKNHVKQYGESLRQNKPQTQAMQEAFARGTAYGEESRRWKEVTAAVTIYICKDIAPIYTVEKWGFRELVPTLDPRYRVQIDMWHVLMPK